MYACMCTCTYMYACIYVYGLSENQVCVYIMHTCGKPESRVSNMYDVFTHIYIYSFHGCKKTKMPQLYLVVNGKILEFDNKERKLSSLQYAVKYTQSLMQSKYCADRKALLPSCVIMIC
jgi:hypothetical protein